MTSQANEKDAEDTALRDRSGVTVAVVGGTGLIGSAIHEALLARGVNSVVVSSRGGTADAPDARRASLLEAESLAAAFESVDAVVQSANFSTYPIVKRRHAQGFYTFDLHGVTTLLAAAKRAGVSRVVFVSGVGAKPGRRAYFDALGRGEARVLASPVSGAVLRPAFVYGPRDRGLNKIGRFVRRFAVLPHVGLGRQVHQPVFVDDVGRAGADLVLDPALEGVFEIGGPEQMTAREMIDRYCAVARLKHLNVPVPVPLILLCAGLLELLPGPPLTRDAVHFATESFVSDNARLDELPSVGTLTGLEDGLKTYAAR